MLEIALVSLTTFFATVGPLDVAALFAVWTADRTAPARRQIARRATLIASVVLVTFALCGNFVLDKMGIGLPALQVAGGILLLLIGIDMVFARGSAAGTPTNAESDEASQKADIAIFPLAMPMLAGPGAMAAVAILMAGAAGNFVTQLIVITALLAIMGVAWLCMLLSTPLVRLLGVTGIHVIARVAGILLTAMAVQTLFNGLSNSGLLD